MGGPGDAPEGAGSRRAPRFGNAGGAPPVAMVMRARRRAGRGGVGGLGARSPAAGSAREGRARAFFPDPRHGAVGLRRVWKAPRSPRRRVAETRRLP